MPNFDKHSPGNFVWFELSTTDPAGAKRFYSPLFGWDPQDAPMSPDMVYTTFRLKGRNVSGAYTMKAEDREMGIPSNWMIYIAVENADATVAHILEHGGNPVSPAFDIPNVGRMAVIQDPGAAVFAIYQPGKVPGVGIFAEPGAFCWADLATPDRDRAAKFYGTVFGWEFTLGKDKDPDGYLHIKNHGEFIGGMPPTHALHPSIAPHWMPYIQTADCQAQTARATELGGRVILPPVTVENQLTYSVVAEPQGAVFALFAPPQ
jgi:predicted enzyme related to lactoylglutathione lyase